MMQFVINIIAQIVKYKSNLSNTIRRLYISKIYNKKVFLANVWLGKSFELDIKANEFKLVFDRGVYFRKNSIICIRNKGKLSVGENVFFNNGISINCHNSIQIGKNCLFGENIKLYDHNHKFRNKQMPISQQGYSYGSITIGNNCWIGSNVVILKNVVIGNNVIIGANCTIFEDIDSYTIVKTNKTLEQIIY